MINTRNAGLLLGLGVLGLASVVPASAQISFTGATLTQNFNGLANTLATNPFPDPNVPGFVSNRTVYTASNGSSGTGALYSFGSAASTDRALGSVASGTTGTIFYGVQITNNTGAAITDFTVNYTGEQWRNGGNTTAQTLSFEYSTTATDVTTGTYTAVTALDFTSPTTGATAAALDGNAAANRTVIGSTVALPTSLASGSSLFLRFVDLNSAGSDHGLAVDDFSFTAAVVPAPSSVAVMALGGLMPLVAIARRRRAAK